MEIKIASDKFLVAKLEELYEVIQSLSRYYGKFMALYFKVGELRDSEQKELQTLAQYYQIRDQKISEEERLQIYDYLSRIEVLAECYTKKDLKKKLLSYENMMCCFADFVFNASSIDKELNYKNGFPDYEDFYLLITKLKKGLIAEIKI